MKFSINAETEEATLTFDTHKDSALGQFMETFLSQAEELENAALDGAPLPIRAVIEVPAFTIEMEVT